MRWVCLSQPRLWCSQGIGRVLSQVRWLVVTQVVPSLDAVGLDLLQSMLRYEPNKRVTARMALSHPYFADIEELYALQLPLT